MLDRRPAILLAWRGAGIDHSSAAVGIAALVETVATHPGQRMLKAADFEAPSALEIARIIARHLDHQWDEVMLDGGNGSRGDHPWNAARPIVSDMRAAHDLGYVPAGTYGQIVLPEIVWLVDAARSGGDQRRNDFDDWFARSHFDYGAQDNARIT